MSAEQRPNRGARGWEAPLKMHVGPISEGHVFTVTWADQVTDPVPAIDLVKYNGVWMTPEDARLARG